MGPRVLDVLCGRIVGSTVRGTLRRLWAVFLGRIVSCCTACCDLCGVSLESQLRALKTCALSLISRRRYFALGYLRSPSCGGRDHRRDGLGMSGGLWTRPSANIIAAPQTMLFACSPEAGQGQASE
ncbi:hypothetical protein OBBRIDRAFT_551815 [Obba rivulosa]|uniref:Uncharacterized protein n=1 Tax=Obba rivulosa TaxID=1052685 RepID=A0A8E2AZG2_9APHY|nr:hypothetical protein OBBRIDRAFT_551815 [Obba rivulosa]